MFDSEVRNKITLSSYLIPHFKHLWVGNFMTISKITSWEDNQRLNHVSYSADHFITCNSCCCDRNCCCSNNSFCILSCVFCSCNNCVWYSCLNCGGKFRSGRVDVWLICDSCRNCDRGFARGIHSLLDTCRDHLSAETVFSPTARLRQMLSITERLSLKIWK